MLHEILLALLGHPGAIIVPVTADSQIIINNNDTNDIDEDAVIGFEVAHGIDFIPSAEKQLLNQIVKMGYYYRCIERFIEAHQSLRVSVMSFNMRKFSLSNDPTLAGQSSQPGLYVRALCVGLDEFLDGYRGAILKTEQDILAEPHHQYPLSKLRVALNDYSVILPHLKELISEIQGHSGTGTLRGRSLHGGEILQRLYRRSLIGIPYVRTCMKRLLFHCNSVLFHQISAWVVNGLITDPYDEFFIEDKREDNNNEEFMNNTESISGNDDKLSVFSMKTTSSTTSSIGTSLAASYYNNGNETINWNVCFQLRLGMLPTAYFPIALAKKILFVGKSVCILENTHNKQLNTQLNNYENKNNNTIKNKHTPLLPHSDALTFAKAIHILREKPNFDLLSVNQAVDAMRMCVNKHLWHLVVKEARLYKHLKALKDFYLVGRGEFYQSFIELIDERGMFDAKANVKLERDINEGPFQIAAQQLNMEDDEFFERFRVRLEKTAFHFGQFNSNSIARYGDAVSNVNIINGSTTLHNRKIRLSNGDANQFGSVWYDTRKTVSRGFTSRFRFQLSKHNKDIHDNDHDDNNTNHDNELLIHVRETATSDNKNHILPWSWGEGFSFVVQNYSLLATPRITRANLDIQAANGNHHHHHHHKKHNNNNNNNGNDNNNLSFVKGGISANCKVSVMSDLSSNNSITGVGIDRHHGDAVRNEGVPNSLEIYFHISPTDPTSNHICVYGRRLDHDNNNNNNNNEQPSRLLGHSKANDPLIQTSTAAIPHLGDGKEHVIYIKYDAPSHVHGKLRVYIDDVTVPALIIDMDLEKFMRLDDGRAWVGFSTVNGYLSMTPTKREKRYTVGNIEFARDILLWEFEEKKSSATWRNIQLEYKLEAPLNLLLLNDDFDRYNALFEFLFMAKHAQLKLQKTWPLFMHFHRKNNGHKIDAETRKWQYDMFRPITSLRHNMQFFIDNLQYYLQVDVFEAQYEQLLKTIEESKDFESVHQAHHDYLNRLTRLCFRNHPTLPRCLNRIFDKILEFCNLVSQYVATPNQSTDLTERTIKDVERITVEFEKQAGLLFNIIGKQSSYYTSPHSAQLVLRLDYNRFFSEKSKFLRE